MKEIPDNEKTAEDWASLPDVVVLNVGMVNALVCAKNDVAGKDIEAALNREHPTGISSDWKLAGGTRPEACRDGRPDATHYVLYC